jgi:signal peptide peptidase SppA
LRAFDLACTVPWAIRPDALSVILDLAARAEVAPEVIAAAMTNGTPEAVAARLGRPLDNAHAVTMHGNVAVIPVSGPIFRYANLFAEISGATSTEVLAKDLRAALDDPSVSGILLEVDSPGGEVAGTAELAAMIRAAAAEKPVHAYVDDLGASAAYWLSSATERITASSTAILGSIGVVSALPNPQKRDAKDIEFVSSQSPKKRADITTEAGRAQVQTVVDALADVFVSDVARYRGVGTDAVLSDFGQGDVFVGQSAVDAGLADGIGSFEQALAGLRDAAQRRGGPTARIGRAAMSMREKFNAWLDGQDAPASADMEAAIVTDRLITQPVQPVTPPPAAPASPSASVASFDATALTERMSAMEAELAAAKALTESQAGAIQQLSDRNAALATEARAKRFMDEVMGKSAASGTRWVGEPEQHVAMLEHLANTAGEDAPLFAAYVANQRALGEQLRASKLFSEVGSGQGAALGGDAMARINALASARASEKGIGFSEAMAQIEREQPALMAEYRESATRRI